MMVTPKLAPILEIADRILVSWWTLVFGAAIGLLGATALLRVSPKTYEATTTIFVAPSQIPLQMVRSQVTDDMGMRLASLREAVLSRPYLVRLAADVFGKSAEEAERLELFDEIRGRLTAEIIRFDAQRGTGVFALTYRDSDPERTARLVNTLGELFIEENLRARSAAARTTTSVMVSLADETRAELERQEQTIAEFKGRHLYDSVDQMEANIRLLEGRQNGLENNERELAQAVDRRDLLAAQLRALAEAPAVPAGSGTAESPAAQLARLRTELDALRSRYSDAHPAVRAHQRQIAELQDSIAAAGDAAPSDSAATSGVGASLTAQLRSAEREIARLTEDRSRIRADIALYQRRIENTPNVEQQLAELTKGYDVLKEKFKYYQGMLESARGSEKVEEVRLGEQFQVMERAVPPLRPIRPVPQIVLLLGVATGCALMVAPIVFSALLAPKIFSRTGLRLLAPVPVLVVIGRIMTPEMRARRLRRYLWNLTASLVSALLFAAAVVLFPR